MLEIIFLWWDSTKWVTIPPIWRIPRIQRQSRELIIPLTLSLIRQKIPHFLGTPKSPNLNNPPLMNVEEDRAVGKTL